MDAELYKRIPADFYATQYSEQPENSIQRLTQLWFRRRQDIVCELVKRHHHDGVVVDVGAGNSLWNQDGIPALGIDFSQAMLRHNIRAISSYAAVTADVRDGLPLKDESVDLVVVSELLEHLPDYTLLLAEITRVLKPGGCVICSVPYQELPGLWGILFPLWCRYKAIRFKDSYYKHHCGHCVSFGKASLKASLSPLQVIETYNLCFLTLFMVARKDGAGKLQQDTNVD